MTTLTGRTGHAHRARATARDHLTHPLDHSPEVLLALAAVLVVLAGPVARAVSPDNPLVMAASAVLLLAGLVLAAVSATRLLRG